MYHLDFLKSLVAHIEALNNAARSVDWSEITTPYVQFAPVLLDGEVQGWLVDEVDGSYAFVPASDEEAGWWRFRPQSLGNRR